MAQGAIRRALVTASTGLLGNNLLWTLIDAGHEVCALARSYNPPAVAQSQVRRTDGRRRTIHSRTTPTPLSTAPGHGCMKSLSPTHRTLGTLQSVSPKCASVTPRHLHFCPRPGSLRPSTRLCMGTPAATPAALTTPVNFHTPRSLHLICISPASGRASGFLLTAFSHATPHTFFQPKHSSRRRVAG